MMVLMFTLVNFEFPFDGPFGTEAVEPNRALVEDIAQEEGLVWKVWTEAPERNIAGGVYLFTNEADADRYAAKHKERLEGFGITGITATKYQVNEELSKIGHTKLNR